MKLPPKYTALQGSREALLSALHEAGAVGDGNALACPWHEDKTASLSVFQDAEGAVWRWRCHACGIGGDLGDVVSRLEGLPAGSAIHRTVERYGHGDARGKASPVRKTAKVYASLDAAVQAVERRTQGRCTRRDEYQSGDCSTAFYVLRIETPQGKIYRPVAPEGNGWRLGDPPGKLPLFGLPELHIDQESPVVVVEGEKAATALQSTGTLATTSAHGAKAESKSDWTPLSGRDVILWPDHDEAGAEYSSKVRAILAQLDPPPRVRVVNPAVIPGLPEKGDAYDVVDRLRGDGMSPAEIREALEGIYSEAREAPRAWESGIDLRNLHAIVRLEDPAIFAPITFYRTGWNSFDAALGGGLARGECTNAFAPAGMGKTTWSINLILNLARLGTGVLLVSLEMPAVEIWKLVIAILAEVPRLHLRHATLTSDEQERIKTAKEIAKQLPLYVLDRTAFPVHDEHPEAPDMKAVGAAIRDAARHCGVKVVGLDHMAKVGPFGQDDLRRIPILTNWIFDTAQRVGVHFLTLHQTNKASFSEDHINEDGSRKVTMSDPKGGIEVIADFDNVVGLARNDWGTDAPADTVNMRAVALKVRYGRAGTAYFEFNKTLGIVRELDGKPPVYKASRSSVEAGISQKLREMLSNVPVTKAQFTNQFQERYRVPNMRARSLIDGVLTHAGIVQPTQTQGVIGTDGAFACTINRTLYLCGEREPLDELRHKAGLNGKIQPPS